MGNDWKMASERNAPAPQAASLRFARVMGSLKLGGTVVGELRCVSCVLFLRSLGVLWGLGAVLLLKKNALQQGRRREKAGTGLSHPPDPDL